jgi:predicted peptidase
VRSARRLFLLSAICCLLSCSRQAQFLERSVTIGERTYKYRVWLPPHYSKVHHWPVVLYLHGSAERGDDNVRQLASGLPIALTHHAQRYKCIVVIPQCHDGEEWYGEMETQALAALEETIREFRGDRRRLYITGVSMGGAGTWYMARHRRWAAVLPVCGEVSRQPNDPFPSDPPPDLARIVGAADPFAAMAAAIGPTPVWAFHGSADPVIPVTQSRAMTAALGNTARYTEYKGAGHAIWDAVYADPNVAHWMLAQKKKR